MIGYGDPSQPENYQETIDKIDYVRNKANTFQTLPEHPANNVKYLKINLK